MCRSTGTLQKGILGYPNHYWCTWQLSPWQCKTLVSKESPDVSLDTVPCKPNCIVTKREERRKILPVHSEMSLHKVLDFRWLVMSVLTEHKGPKSLLFAGHSFASVVSWELRLLALVQYTAEEMGWINGFLSTNFQCSVFVLRKKKPYIGHSFFFNLVLQILNICSARHIDNI